MATLALLPVRRTTTASAPLPQNIDTDDSTCETLAKKAGPRKTKQPMAKTCLTARLPPPQTGAVPGLAPTLNDITAVVDSDTFTTIYVMGGQRPTDDGDSGHNRLRSPQVGQGQQPVGP